MIKEQKKNAPNVIKDLSELIDSKESEISNLKLKYSRLLEDFNYNLNLLEQRDKELDKNDSLIELLKKSLFDKEAEQEKFKVQIKENEGLLNSYQADYKENEKKFKDEIIRLNKELKAANELRESSLRICTENYESEKRSLTRKIAQAEQQMETMRKQFSTGTEEAIKQIRLDTENKLVLLEDDLNKTKTQLKASEQRLLISSQENEKLITEVAHLKEMLTNNEKDSRRVKWESEDNISILSSKLNESEKEKEKLMSEMRRIKGEAEMWEQRYNELSLKEIPGYKKECSNLKQEKENLEMKIRGIVEEKKSLQKTIEENLEKLGKKDKKEHEIKMVFNKSQDMIAKLKAQVTVMNKECSVRDEVINQQRSEIELLTKRLALARDRLGEKCDQVRKLKDIPRAVSVLVDEHEIAIREVVQVCFNITLIL